MLSNVTSEFHAKRFAKTEGVSLEAVSTRPILPFDVGKADWKWANHEEIKLANKRSAIVLDGLYSPNLVAVWVRRAWETWGNKEALLTSWAEFREGLYIGGDDTIQRFIEIVEFQHYPVPPTPTSYIFALGGWIIEVRGQTIM